MKKLKNLKELINDSENIVIIPHTSPDGDAIGSCLAFLICLIQLINHPNVISPNKAPDFLNWTPGYDNIIYFDSDEEKCKESLLKSDLVFTLDFNDLNRIGELNEFVKKSNSKIVMIDHHQNPKDYADLVFSEPKTGSTCELLYEIFESIGLENKLNKDISSCLYLGIMTDTGSFQFSSVTARTHEIISNLLSKKIDHNKIYNKVYNDSSESRLKVLGCCFEKFNSYQRIKHCFYVTKKR